MKVSNVFLVGFLVANGIGAMYPKGRWDGYIWVWAQKDPEDITVKLGESFAITFAEGGRLVWIEDMENNYNKLVHKTSSRSTIHPLISPSGWCTERIYMALYPGKTELTFTKYVVDLANQKYIELSDYKKIKVTIEAKVTCPSDFEQNE